MAAERPHLSIDALIDHRPVSGLQARVIALCGVATFLDGYDIQALGLSIPKMAAEFGIAPTAFAGAVSGSLAGMALGAVALSPLADRFGRRPMMIALLLWIALTTAGAAFANGALELTVWRVLSGLGLGALVPVAIALTSEYAPKRRRAALITLMVSFTAVGAFAGGLIAPIVDAAWGWRGIFGAGALAPAATALLCVVALPESLRILVARQPDSPAVARQVARIAPDLAGARLRPEATAKVQTASVKALFSAPLRRRTVLLWTLFWINLFVNYGLISWLPTLLTQAGWEHAAALRASGVLAIGGIAGSLLISAIADRGHAVPALIAGYALAAAVLVGIALGPTAKPVWIALLALGGMGAFGAQIAVGSLAATYYPLRVRSTGVGWSSGFGRVGSFVGPLFMAGLMSAGMAPAWVIGTLAVPMVLCAGIVGLLPGALAVKAYQEVQGPKDR